ncbi:MAG: FAD:protein FMN transferase [Bacteroidales bacterium]|jgi:thiamine biosynthesis lipoprotein|nr:FAD:protein FMN transferase [Bacteroidales bacterium]
MKKLTIFLFAALLFCSCRSNLEVHKIEGKALGTYYSILYTGKEDPDLPTQIDSILSAVSLNLSIFDTNSNLYRVNHNLLSEVDDEFAFILDKSLKISKITGGAFDPTIEPLVEFWGFGKANPTGEHNQAVIDSLRAIVGYEKVWLQQHAIAKQDHRIQLNFNAIAKGYAVDKVADFLVKKNYLNCLVEIGGEVMAHGLKGTQNWIVGIQTPTETQDGTIAALYFYPLQEKATATSGNYRNYKEEDGVRYSHIIDPQTGRPEKSDLLSVSVVASDCMTADAFATAFMVMGMKKSMQFLKQHPELDACFIYVKEDKMATTATNNFPVNLH